MKRYSFHLQKLLELKKFQEDLEKAKLGEINKEITERKDRILFFKNAINKQYETQEKNLQQDIKAADLSIYSFLIQSYRSSIDKLNEELLYFQKRYEEQLKKMLEKRNELEVLITLKEKDYKNFVKKENKKIEVFIDDINAFKRFKEKQMNNTGEKQ